MISSKDAKIGARVKWTSLDISIPSTKGTITTIHNGEAMILCDDPDPDTGDCESSTWLDSGASCWKLI